MAESTAERVAVRPAGAPGTAWLEMRGSILIYRRKSWVASFSAYLPVEWIERQDSLRHDWQLLWQGIIAGLIAVLFALPLAVCIKFRVLLTTADALWLGPMGTLFLAMLGTCIALTVAFMSRRPCTTLEIGTAPGNLAVRFWRSVGADDAPIESLLKRLAVNQASRVRDMLPALHVNHGWYQPDPYRMALVKGLIISFFLYLALLAWALAAFFGGLDPFSPWCFLILAAPPVFHVALAAVQDLPALASPPAFRRARRHYRRGALESARAELDDAVEADPDDLTVRVLLVRVCAELGAVDAALHHCGRISQERPLVAQALEEHLWAIRRVYERMDVSQTSGE